jgi:hypothetical protein
MASMDRVRIDFTSDVREIDRAYIIEDIRKSASLQALYTYEHFDKESCAWSIDITAHDRSIPPPLTDSQIVARLQVAAEDAGITLAEMLRRASKEALG